MTLRCKPGDLAVIVRATFSYDLRGRIVTVLHAAPSGILFRLPDGCRHCAVPFGYWICEFQAPFTALMDTGQHRAARYAPVSDACLRPIRDPGDDAVDEVLRYAPAPEDLQVLS